MSGFVLSPRAKADLEEIWDYTSARWSLGQAEAYIRRIQAAIETIAAAPRLARSCEDVKAGYWKYPAGSHVSDQKRGAQHPAIPLRQEGGAYRIGP